MQNRLEEWLDKVRQRIEIYKREQMSPEESQRHLDSIAEIERHTSLVNAARISANNEAIAKYRFKAYRGSYSP